MSIAPDPKILTEANQVVPSRLNVLLTQIIGAVNSLATSLATLITTANTVGPVFSAYPSVNQAIVAGGAVNLVAMGTVEFDSASAFAASRFTPLVAGYYLINASVFCSVAGAAMRCIIYKNGAAYKSGAYFTTTSGAGVSTGSTVVFLNGATDYIELWINTVSPGQVDAVSSLTYINGAFLRPA